MNVKKRKKKERTYGFTSNPTSDFEIYKNGAFVGAIIGGIGGLIIGKKIILCIIAGAFVGGYVNYTIHKDDTSTFNLKKFKKSNTTEDDGNN